MSKLINIKILVMGILNDIDTSLSNSDMHVGIIAERKVDWENIKFDIVASNSCHFSILKKFEGRTSKSNKNVQEQILKYDWDCKNILKFFGLNDIYKGVTVCIKARQSEYFRVKPITVRVAIIFRGHKRKDDFAYLYKTFNSNYGSFDVLNNMINTSKFYVKQLFDDEHSFNTMFKYIVGLEAANDRITPDYDKFLNFN